MANRIEVTYSMDSYSAASAFTHYTKTYNIPFWRVIGNYGPDRRTLKLYVHFAKYEDEYEFIKKAYKNGKDIQMRIGGNWLDIKIPLFIHGVESYRVAPPKPFENKDPIYAPSKAGEAGELEEII